MITISTSEVREQIARLIEAVEQGETVQITRDDSVVARLVPPDRDPALADLPAFRSTVRVREDLPDATDLLRKMRDEDPRS